MSNKEIKWFARCDGVSKIGPYNTQVEATNAIRLANIDDSIYAPPIFPSNAFVWPEECDVPVDKSDRE